MDFDLYVDEQDGDMAEDDFDWGDEASTFGDRLAKAREYSGMDQAELARRIGVKLATLRNWEADRSEPRANRLSMLSGLLGVSIIWLMTGEGDGAPEAEPAGAGDLGEVLAELRELRTAQARLAERAGLIEKRLRSFTASNR